MADLYGGKLLCHRHAPKKMGSAHPNIVPYQCFKTRDGKYLTVAVGNDRIWKNFCEALGLEDLIENPKFATKPDRVKNKDELIPLLEKAFLNKTRDEWIAILLKKGVPCGPIAMDEVFYDPQVQHRKMLVEIEHPKIGKIKQIGIPMKFSETPGEIRKPPPLLGQHTKEILKNLLEYSEEEIKQLEREEII
jgi:crotonobetainyl-CoA:carnitine CoA-transferase CaiB-like acyl-CoA transferase